ncbi:uncharacterized protein LOC117067608 [Trachypithecus francoisi]|uniref:uncharacterized protein LOC117067608 n=1 Tax=Trachypithecus francoisi TaxID=54180 RepID=UPI00141AD748|nr:uncharacterized protein LOC117067608 [Trachypithecus francoisi]XP_033040256.1 uncharacterized protein LOC117067608 [Trachypithecus francoisi]XP_033040257.1 uncharacterized protein LOC117067608 [Trachypithecus francoisi]
MVSVRRSWPTMATVLLALLVYLGALVEAHPIKRGSRRRRLPGGAEPLLRLPEPLPQPGHLAVTARTARVDRSKSAPVKSHNILPPRVWSGPTLVHHFRRLPGSPPQIGFLSLHSRRPEAQTCGEDPRGLLGDLQTTPTSFACSLPTPETRILPPDGIWAGFGYRSPASRCPRPLSCRAVCGPSLVPK